jgi:hypothetical protein
MSDGCQMFRQLALLLSSLRYRKLKFSLVCCSISFILHSDKTFSCLYTSVAFHLLVRKGIILLKAQRKLQTIFYTLNILQRLKCIIRIRTQIKWTCVYTNIEFLRILISEHNTRGRSSMGTAERATSHAWCVEFRYVGKSNQNCF